MNLPIAIICDIDGTLAKMGDRSPYDWSKVGRDTLNEPVAFMLNAVAAGWDLNIAIILVSGRDEICRPETEAWLDRNKIHYDELYMRKKGDNRQDVVIKEKIYNEHIKDKFNIKFVLDDRDQVVELWRKKLGLPCFQVDYGDF